MNGMKTSKMNLLLCAAHKTDIKNRKTGKKAKGRVLKEAESSEIEIFCKFRGNIPLSSVLRSAIATALWVWIGIGR